MPYVKTLIGDISEKGYYDNPNNALLEQISATVDANLTAIETVLSGDDSSDANFVTFAASKGAASGLASLNSSSKVVQDPANATATPTASKIAISDAQAHLNGWLSFGTGSTDVAAGNHTHSGVYQPAMISTTTLADLGITVPSYSGKLSAISGTSTLLQLLAAIDAIV